MRILVTGAAGFVGPAVCKALVAAGHEVTGVTRSVPSAPLPSQRTIALGDLGSGPVWDSALSDIDAIVHLAGRAHAVGAHPAQEEALYKRANVDVLGALAEAAVRRGVKRFLFVSSIKVNGEETFGVPFSARDTPAPEDVYGRSKAEAEELLRRIAADKMEWVIFRPPLMYGPGVRGNLAKLFRIAERSLPLPIGSVRNARDLLYVGSLAELIVVAIGSPRAANRVFLARDGTPVSTPDLFRMIAAAIGRRAIVVPCPVSVLKIAGRLTGSETGVRRLVGDLEIDDSETRATLGWCPKPSLLAGLKEAAGSHDR